MPKSKLLDKNQATKVKSNQLAQSVIIDRIGKLTINSLNQIPIVGSDKHCVRTSLEKAADVIKINLPGDTLPRSLDKLQTISSAKVARYYWKLELCELVNNTSTGIRGINTTNSFLIAEITINSAYRERNKCKMQEALERLEQVHALAFPNKTYNAYNSEDLLRQIYDNVSSYFVSMYFNGDTNETGPVAALRAKSAVCEAFCGVEIDRIKKSINMLANNLYQRFIKENA
jgi:hypothetical protein